MITVLTSFKPFEGDDAIRQTNALLSWRAFGPEVEIIAFGKTPGLRPVAEKFKICHVPGIPSSDAGLPRIDAIFEFAQARGKHDLQVYVNGDILLFDDFMTALQSIAHTKFVMVGQRLDIDVRELLDFSNDEGRRTTKQRLASAACLHDVGGMDYFAYRRGSMPSLPPLYLGAASWDNTVLYTLRRANVPVIDATLDVRVFHQNHEYKRLASGERVAYEGPAALANLAQIEDELYRFYTTDASHWLNRGRIRSSLWSPRHAWRMVLTYPLVRGWRGPIRWPFRLAATLLRRLGVAWMRFSRRHYTGERLSL